MSEDALELAQVILRWHENLMTQAALLTDVEKGTELRIQWSNADKEPIVLTGHEADMFRLGVSTGMELFRELPFTLSRDDEDD